MNLHDQHATRHFNQALPIYARLKDYAERRNRPWVFNRPTESGIIEYTQQYDAAHRGLCYRFWELWLGPDNVGGRTATHYAADCTDPNNCQASRT